MSDTKVHTCDTCFKVSPRFGVHFSKDFAHTVLHIFGLLMRLGAPKPIVASKSSRVTVRAWQWVSSGVLHRLLHLPSKPCQVAACALIAICIRIRRALRDHTSTEREDDLLAC